jgi:hypothetical protein
MYVVEGVKVSETVDDLFSDGDLFCIRKGDRSIDHSMQIPSFAILEKQPVRMNGLEGNQILVHAEATVTISFFSEGVHAAVGHALWVLQYSEAIFQKPNEIP